MTASLTRASPDTVVILVHGTFAKAATWPDPEGPMARSIAEAMPGAAIEPFVWCGRNGYGHRAQAGRELAARLDDLIAKGARRIYAVGHSHGGNVILKALERDDLARRVKGIAFLGTPFLSAAERRTGPLVQAFTYAATPLLILLAIMAAALPLGWLAGDLAMLGPVVIGGLAGGFGFERLRRFLKNRLERRLDAAGKVLMSLALVPTPACPVLVLATPRDEPAGWLDFIDRLAASPWWLLGRLAAGLGSLILGSFVCAVLIALFPELEGSSAEALVSSVYLGILVGVALLAMPFAFLAATVRSTKLTFGGEDPAAVVAVRVVPQTFPPWIDLAGSSREEVHPREGAWAARLRGRPHHSFFYSDPEVVGRVSRWLAETDAGASRSGSARRAAPLPPRLDDIPPIWFVAPGIVLVLAFAAAAIAEQRWEARNTGVDAQHAAPYSRTIPGGARPSA